jgi:hypothetical protein
MVFFRLKPALSLLILLSVGLNGCARRVPTSLDQLSIHRKTLADKDANRRVAVGSEALTEKTARSFTPFEEIVVSLVFDSLDLLPVDSSSKIYDVILAGIEIPEESEILSKNILTSPKKEDIALIAGYIVQQVYGESIGNEIVIPQAILLFHKEKVKYSDITALKSRLITSENRYMDAYDICLSLLVNLLSDNYKIQQKNREGLYLRDFNNNLYFHKEVKL